MRLDAHVTAAMCGSYPRAPARRPRAVSPSRATCTGEQPAARRRMKAKIIAIILAAIGLSSSPARATIVSDWNATALAEVRLSTLGPPIVARALAIAHTCMYDAWAAYDSVAIGTA